MEREDEDPPFARNAAPFLLWVLLSTSLLAVSLIDHDFERRHSRLDLAALLSEQRSGVVAESALGEVLWLAERPLKVSLGSLRSGDEIELRYRADCQRSEFIVETAGAKSAIVARDMWQDATIVLDREVDLVVLRSRGVATCGVHLSRFTATNVTDFGRGLVEYYRYRDTKHRPSVALGWLILLLPLPVLARGAALPVLQLSSGLVVLDLFAALSRFSGLCVALRAHSFMVVLVLVPVALRVARGGWLRGSAIRKRCIRAGHPTMSFLRRPEGQLCLILLLAAGSYGMLLDSVVSQRWNGDLRGLPRFKQSSYFPSALRSEMPTSPGGHDGQFYALLASDPLLLEASTRGSIDQPRFRARRVLLPMMAWLSTGTRGGSGAIVAYIALTLFGSLAAVGLAGLLFLRNGVSPWLCVPLVLQAGTFVSVTRSLLDTSAVALTLAALLASVRRPALAGTATTTAALCKETSLFVAVALGLQACQEQRWRRGLALVVFPVAVLGAWVFSLHLRVPANPSTGSNFSWPFHGLVQKLSSGFEVTGSLLQAEIAATGSVLLGFPMAAILGRRLVRERGLSAAGWNLLALTALSTIASLKIFASVRDYSRVFLLLPFLALVIAAESRDRATWLVAGSITALGAYAGLHLWLIEL
ncbi:MAG: hypothetical protein AAGA81_14155 [Acidobacteriota bacterium]